MKTIVLHAVDFQDSSPHYVCFKDQAFLREIQKRGYTLVESRAVLPERIDYVLFLEAESLGVTSLRKKAKAILRGKFRDALAPEFYNHIKSKIGIGKTYLFVAEGILHKPENHCLCLQNLVNGVLTWNDSMVDGVNFHKYHWPQPLDWDLKREPNMAKRKMLVNISANKYSKSVGELYTARRTAIRVFESQLGDQFDHYGFGWNRPATRIQRFLPFTMPIYKSYRGEIKSKSQILQEYKFSLCYENACVPGWITEKIFDSLRSYCIPIYLGAPNIGNYVPSSIFIDRRNFNSDLDVVQYIVGLSEAKMANIQTEIGKYLHSKLFSLFSTTALAHRVIDVIENAPFWKKNAGEPRL